MFASLRLRSVRPALVILLMILSAFVAMERAQAVVNGVQHALSIEHAAPAFDLAAADHDPQDDHDHPPPAGDRSGDAGEQDPAPGPHHQHPESPQVAALISPVTVDVVVSRSEARFERADAGSPLSRIFGLERPPKALGDRA